MKPFLKCPMTLLFTNTLITKRETEHLLIKNNNNCHGKNLPPGYSA